MGNLIIDAVNKNLEVVGETIGGKISSGRCNIYTARAENFSWDVELAHTIWENGEEEISAKKGNPEILQLIKNRLRMVISKTESSKYPDTKFVTLHKALLSISGNTEWANLHNISLGELSEYLGGNANKYFKKLGAKTLDYKIDVFKQTGPCANQLVVIFPKENIEVIIHAFIITRVYPLLIK